MKILFTGSSSFTGYWFVRTLVERGHQVSCTFTGATPDDYPGIRGERVAAIAAIATPVWGTRFGDDAFVRLIATSRFDLLCHHGAWVVNYRDAAFDVAAALANNTRNVLTTLAALRESGCRSLVLTGSVFEGGEGAGSDALPHFSPYGLSKALTAETIGFYAGRLGMTFGRFVIANPFGPFEEPRFTSYLFNAWRQGQTPGVKTPDYVRDNMPVGLLALYYREFCEAVTAHRGAAVKITPSGIVGSQGAFAELVAREASARLGRACSVVLEEQRDFSEPMIRIGTDRNPPLDRAYDLAAFWDAFVEFYASRFAPKA